LSAPIQYDADFEEIADATKRAQNEFEGNATLGDDRTAILLCKR